jgi:hypothetical protein
MDSGKIGRSCLEKGLRKGRGGHGEVKGMASDYWARGLFLKLNFFILSFLHLLSRVYIVWATFSLTPRGVLREGEEACSVPFKE